MNMVAHYVHHASFGNILQNGSLYERVLADLTEANGEPADVSRRLTVRPTTVHVPLRSDRNTISKFDSVGIPSDYPVQEIARRVSGVQTAHQPSSCLDGVLNFCKLPCCALHVQPALQFWADQQHHAQFSASRPGSSAITRHTLAAMQGDVPTKPGQQTGGRRRPRLASDVRRQGRQGRISLIQIADFDVSARCCHTGCFTVLSSLCRQAC